MANQLHTNPWVLDTADTANSVANTPVRARSIVWSGYNAAADRCVIKDGRTLSDSSGPTKLFDMVGRTDLSPVEIASGEGIWIMNFLLYQLDSGIVTVLLK